MKEKFTIIFLIFLFVFIRSIHFSEFLNFSHDQALFSLNSLQIYNDHIFTLVGPSISFNLNGREIFQGSIIYYFQLFFLKIGDFDPIKSSYAFMLFSAAMIIPLYFGIKKLINQKCALLIIIIYTLLPYYVDYTRFLWNPNYQLSLTPILILLMGLYKRGKNLIWLLLISVWLGVLLQFHYQFILVIVGLLIYYIFIQRVKLLGMLLFFLGLCMGFSPIIIFEFRNNFYNSKTFLLFVQNSASIMGNGSSIFIQSHYLLTVSLFIIIILIILFRKYIGRSFLIISATLLFLLDLLLFLPTPSHGFGMINNWSYLDEVKVYKIIRAENLESYNIANLSYNTLSLVQKYLLEKDHVKGNFYDYKNNQYLFVVNNDKNFMINPAYEVNTFKPSTTIKEWKINNLYNLYLLKRTY